MINNQRITGALSRKAGRYYAVIYYRDEDGRRRSKTVATGILIEAQNKRLQAKNERAARRKLEELIREFSPPEDFNCTKVNYFANDVREWLERKQQSVAPSTRAGYQYAVNDIVEYFSTHARLRTTELKSSDIEDYLNWERNRRKPNSFVADKKRIKDPDGSGIENTIMRRLAVIRMVLQEAKRDGQIIHNPAAKSDSWITLPKPQAPSYTVLTGEEAKQMRKMLRSEDKWFEVATLLALLYGLRRSEIIGMRVTDIDASQKRIICRNTVTQQTIGGKNILSAKPHTKNHSIKTFILSDEIFELLISLIDVNARYAIEFGVRYDTTWDGYIFRYPDGKLITPNHLTQHFSLFLKRNGLKKMRFHDLRHSCASILYSQGVAPKTIQQILGHTQLSTTTEIYTHLFGSEKDVAIDNLSVMLLGTNQNAKEENCDGNTDGTCV